MGIIQYAKNKILGPEPYNFILIGPDSSGKSATLFKFQFPDEKVKTLPSIGINPATIYYKKQYLCFVDIKIEDYDNFFPYDENNKDLYLDYDSEDEDENGIYPELPSKINITKFDMTDAVIIVIDSVMMHKENYFCDLVSLIEKVLKSQILKNKPLLVYANKQDMKNAMDIDEIANSLELYEIRDRKWFIIGSSAVTGEGLYGGLDWLIEHVDKIKAEEAEKVKGKVSK